MPVEDYCQKPVQTAEPEEALRAAAQRMEKQGVGSLVVIEDDRAIGVLTDRGLALHALAGRLDPDETQVRNALERPAVSVARDAALDDAAELMRRNRLRRLPVVDDADRVVGILSADDVVRVLAEEISALAHVTAGQLPVAASAGAEAAGAAASTLSFPRTSRRAEHYHGDVKCLRADADVYALAELMKAEAVGCVVATGDGDDAIGIVTDRDLAIRVVAAGRDPDATPVSAIMSAPPVTARATDTIEEVVAKMSARGVRRVPILSGSRAVGLVSFDDLLVTFGRELAEIGAAVRGEIRHEHRAAQVEGLRETLEANLRELGSKAAELGADSVEALRKEIDGVWQRLRRR